MEVNHMKKKLAARLMASSVAVLMLTGCGANTATTTEKTPAEDAAVEEETAEEAEEPVDEADPVTLNIFAAASMTETLTTIQEMYQEVAPNVTLVFDFDSSGTLKTQIQEGAECDVFISAAQKQMNQLDITQAEGDSAVNTEGLDFVLEGSRINLLENKVVLAVPDGNPAGKTGGSRQDYLWFQCERSNDTGKRGFCRCGYYLCNRRIFRRTDGRR
jgi:molybdate transport system substrate-binding protein